MNAGGQVHVVFDDAIVIDCGCVINDHMIADNRVDLYDGVCENDGSLAQRNGCVDEGAGMDYRRPRQLAFFNDPPSHVAVSNRHDGRARGVFPRELHRTNDGHVQEEPAVKKRVVVEHGDRAASQSLNRADDHLGVASRSDDVDLFVRIHADCPPVESE